MSNGHLRTIIAPAALTLSATLAVMGQETTEKNRFAISYRPGLNIKGTFSGIGAAGTRRSNPGPPTGGVDHEYDDGYVRVDSTNNGLDLTWNWGFERPEQVVGDDLEMRSSSTMADGRRSTDDVQHGFEVTYGRELGVVRKARWGFEGALNYTYVGLKESGSAPVTTVTTVDTYDVSGIDPFDPPGSQTPYRGTFAGPGTLIPDAPISRRQEITAGGAVVTGKRELDANVFGMRIGPYIDLPLSSKWLVTLNAGFALVSVSSDFKFSEALFGQTLRGSDADFEVLPGGYVGANISFEVARATRLFAGAEYQYVGDFTQDAGGKRAKLELGNTVFVKAGISYSF